MLGLASPVRGAVWVERATTKVLKDFTPAGKAVQVHLEAARNEYEAFQVVVAAGPQPLTGVIMELSDLEAPGAVIPAAQARLYLEYYVQIDKPSPCDSLLSQNCGGHEVYIRVPGQYPDALIPFFDPYCADGTPVAVPFDVPAGDLQTVFVDLHIPPAAAPGTYEGQLAVLADGVQIALLPVTLEVWDFEIPVARHVATAYGFSAGHIGKYHGGPEGPDPEHLGQLARNYELEVHRHRLDYTTHNPGQKFEFDEEGQLLPIDFTAYDDYLGPRIDGSFYPDGAGINRYNLGMFRPGHGTMGMTEEQFALAAGKMAAHLDAKGWLDHVYLYSLDEPWLLDHWRAGSYEKIAATVALLNQHTDLWQGHVLITGPWQEALDDCGDIWCPVTPMYGDVFWPPGSWPGPQKYQELISGGDELWFYVCNANFPPAMGYDIDAGLGYEPRLTKWGAWYEGATGFLYWSMSYWFTSDPWHDLANWEYFGELFSRNGDGILLYPGDHDGTAGGAGSPDGVALDGPVVSYRMKQIRDGLEDWELFILAAELGAKEYARQQVSTVYRQFGQRLDDEFRLESPPWTLDDGELHAARRAVALKVQHLLHPEKYEDPEAPARAGPETEPRAEPVAESAAPDGAGQESWEVLFIDGTPEGTVQEPLVKKKSGGCSAGPAGVPGFPASALLLLALLACRAPGLTRGRRRASPQDRGPGRRGRAVGE